MDFRKIKDGLLHVNYLRKFIGNEIFFESMKSKFKKQEILEWPKAKILVLSPHPDDDALGCGGAIKINTDLGNEVKIVYLTDGSAGFADVMRPTQKEMRELARTRENEAKCAAQVLKVEDLTFWRYKDGQLSQNKTSVKLLDRILSDYRPDAVFLPFFLDVHPDHFATCQIFAESLRNSDLNPLIYSYEVWSPLFPNRIVNIDKVNEVKRESIKCHKSQLLSRPFLSGLAGLNAYRAIELNSAKSAEAFLLTSKKLYLSLIDLIEQK